MHVSKCEILKGLYAEVYLTYEDMNKMFDGRHYRRMRKELPLTEEAFPEIYDKISKLGRSTTSDATDADK